MKSKDIKLDRTCTAAPEQYDAYYKNQLVGYLRLRRGCFTVECPDVLGDIVLCLHPEGYSDFEDYEREYHLEEARRAIVRWHTKRLKKETIWQKLIKFTARFFN